ncbi:F-box/FBD/LRR-repeat protein At1g78750-like [Vicia villosa]|uniref:F-box/FBD/LRR-repeat protein At1g78750-like n=1 Tax=Vicia villosa TaxID=3911 RepID=UPI00273CF4D5|nr:F-box/FBD/LRR-repeat protein At1g78750-like [Vicia villosa]
MIQPETKKVKLNDTELIDKISDLPDCIILHILSLLNTKDAVQTCILSVRWKDLWKRLPALIFRRSGFSTKSRFTKFVSKVLSLHDSSSALQYVDFDNDGCLGPHLIEMVVNYAISHNVQQLGLCVNCNIAQIPLALFSSQTLTHLRLSIYYQDIDIAQFSLNLPALTHLKLILSLYPSGDEILFPKSFNLPSLTNLHLEDFAFCPGENGRAEPFSVFKRLNSLLLYGFALRDTLTLCISSATLVNLTTKNYSDDYSEIELLTPNLVTFAFYGRPCQKVFGSDLSNVKHVDIDVPVFLLDIKPFLLLSWLLNFDNIKSLTVSTSALQALSYDSNLLKIKHASFGNLKSLKVKKKPCVYWLKRKLLEAKLVNKEPDGIVDFLIQNSPSAEVEIIDCS